MKESCASCRYGRPSRDDKWPELLECRRRPPAQTTRPAADWPHVYPDSWCGEWAGADAAETAVEKPAAVAKQTRTPASRETR